MRTLFDRRCGRQKKRGFVPMNWSDSKALFVRQNRIKSRSVLRYKNGDVDPERPTPLYMAPDIIAIINAKAKRYTRIKATAIENWIHSKKYIGKRLLHPIPTFEWTTYLLSNCKSSQKKPRRKSVTTAYLVNPTTQLPNYKSNKFNSKWDSMTSLPHHSSLPTIYNFRLPISSLNSHFHSQILTL